MSKELVGFMSVDAGLCWVGDPCYVMGDDATNRVTDWGSFCNSLDKSGQYNNDYSKPLGEGVGIAVSTGFGDGSYPVYVTRQDGIISSVTVDFMHEEDSEEDYYE